MDVVGNLCIEVQVCIIPQQLDLCAKIVHAIPAAQNQCLNFAVHIQVFRTAPGILRSVSIDADGFVSLDGSSEGQIRGVVAL